MFEKRIFDTALPSACSWLCVCRHTVIKSGGQEKEAPLSLTRNKLPFPLSGLSLSLCYCYFLCMCRSASSQAVGSGDLRAICVRMRCVSCVPRTLARSGQQEVDDDVVNHMHSFSAHPTHLGLHCYCCCCCLCVCVS